MNGKPNIVLMQAFSVRSNYGKYVGYMTRKEALNEKEYLSPEERKEITLMNQILEKDGYFDAKNEVNYSGDPTNKKDNQTIKKIVNDDYGKYIGYMMRSNALAKKERLTPEEQKEKERIDSAANKIIEGKINKADDTLIGWYSSESKTLKLRDKEKVADKLREAEKNGSVLWEPVVSFDNDYLIREGILNPKTDELHDDILKDASYNMMKVAQEKENLLNPYWTASIHRNTDNIHIHFALVEERNTRKIISYEGKTEPKAKFKLSTVYAMKSAFSNTIVDQELSQDRITKDRNKIRENVVENVKEEVKDPNFQTKINNFLKKLPDNKRQWQYATLQKIDPKITDELDDITNYLLKDDKNYKEWSSLVKDLDEIYKGQYGKSENKHKNYAQNEFRDLQKRVGNRLLTEFKKMDSSANSMRKALPKIDPKKSENYIMEIMTQLEKSSQSKTKTSRSTISKSKHSTTSIADKNRALAAKRQRQNNFKKRAESYKQDQYLRKITRTVMNKRSITRLQDAAQQEFENGLTSIDKVKAMREFEYWNRIDKE